MLKKRMFLMSAAASTVLCVLVACATMQAFQNAPTPKTVKQAILLSTNEAAMVVATANDAYSANLIDEKTHLKVLEMASQAKGYLELAVSYSKAGDLKTAQGQLNLTMVLLSQARIALGGTQ